MEHRMRSLFSALVVVCIIAAAAPSYAHPPWNPYDNTQFAPITSFGPKVGIELVTRGVNDDDGNPVGPTLTSPLKVVTAPGLPDHIFIVDQVGFLWTVRRDGTGPRTLYLDLHTRLVPLGVCGPNTFDERGFLGLAFHPNFRNNGKFYTYTSERRDSGVANIRTPGIPATPGTPGTPDTDSSNSDHHNVIIEWVAATPRDPTAPGISPVPKELIRVNWPQFNHDGGDLAFGSDGMLYISMGDGGGADDADGQPFVTAPPHQSLTLSCGEAPIFGHQDNGNGQKLNTPLGKILRIDVNATTPGTAKLYRVPSDNPFVRTPGAVPEIWALGFRNPYRFSFDKKTGDLYVGDVGQNDIEEVDIVKRGGNYGWNCKEGTLFFHIAGSVPDDGFAARKPDPMARRGDCFSGPRPLRDPIAQYDTHHEGHSVIGGYVYDGRAVPALRGKYVFADFSLLFKFPIGPHDYGRLFSVNAGGGDHGLRKISELIVLPGGSVSLAVLGSGLDAQGEIYVTGNVSGLPDNTNSGVVVRIVGAPRAGDEKPGDDDNGNNGNKGNKGNKGKDDDD